MSLLSLVKNFARSAFAPSEFRRGKPRSSGSKTSAAGPMIAWSGVGQPKWTPRRYENLAEEGFRKNVIAYRCVMMIAQASAAIPWLLYDEEGHELDRHPLLDLLRHPNPLQDGVTFLESIYAYLEIAGNAYVEAVRPNGAGSASAPSELRRDKPIELYVLRPDRMKVIPGPAGLPQGYQYTVNGQVTTWPADPISGASNILHLKRFHPLDDWYGMPPMEAAQISIDQHNAAGAWNQALLNQGARPSGALVYAPKDGPASLSDEQMQRLREEIAQMYQGSRNSGRPLVLEGGLEWREMSLSPKDMDWLAGRNVAARDIAQAFGVPSQLVGIPDAQTYANMAEARMAFYEETILPLVTRVIAGFDHWLTPMYDDRLALDFDTDSISALGPRRDAQWAKLQNANFLTRNEKREAAGYGPVPGGDEDGDTDSGEDDPAALDEAIATPLKTPWMPAKFNPYHDPDDGRFTFSPNGPADDNPDDNGDTGTPSDKPSGPGILGLPSRAPRGTPVSDNQTEDQNYPVSTINSVEEAQQLINESNGQYIGKNSQCASLVHALAPGLPSTPQWLPGDRVQGDRDIPVGTPIATFNFQGQDGTNGYGPADQPTGVTGKSHTGIYLGQDSTGLSLLNQWQGSGGPRISQIPWNAWGRSALEGGSRYYTIDYSSH